MTPSWGGGVKPKDDHLWTPSKSHVVWQYKPFLASQAPTPVSPSVSQKLTLSYFHCVCVYGPLLSVHGLRDFICFLKAMNNSFSPGGGRQNLLCEHEEQNSHLSCGAYRRPQDAILSSEMSGPAFLFSQLIASWVSGTAGVHLAPAMEDSWAGGKLGEAPTVISATWRYAIQEDATVWMSFYWCQAIQIYSYF